jgi:hypothetical protein
MRTVERSRRAALAVFGACTLFAAIFSRDSHAEPSDASVAAHAESVARVALPSLEGHAWLENVSGARGEIGKVSVPQGATSVRPWMLALHGANDRAEWACGEWRGVIDAYAFIACPHGAASHLYWDNAQATLAQVNESRDDIAKNFGAYVRADQSPSVAAGFSMGTSMTIAMVEQGMIAPQALVLVEGGYDRVAAKSFPRMLREHHVKRVLFVCTTRGACDETYLAALPKLVSAGIDARVNLAATREHGMWAEVISSIKRDWPWLVRDLDGWQNYAPTLEPNAPGKTVVSPENLL